MTTIRCGQVTPERTKTFSCGSSRSSGALGFGCHGRWDVAALYYSGQQIVLKHDSACNSYFSHSSHLVLLGDQRLREVDSTFTGAPVLRDILPEMSIYTLPLRFAGALHLLALSLSLSHILLVTHKSHPSLISPHLPPGRRDLHRQTTNFPGTYFTPA